ncbi:MAG: exosortase-associated EpsI family protein [Candidatus Omnitrophica bacterium]|nr:exosortase-associated EpsI family protein [Candidatus Poribacteria bacterium]MBM3253649.1 exosortase-associated EpsI family protein [Candidatus Omnitrophota bacterium]
MFLLFRNLNKIQWTAKNIKRMAMYFWYFERGRWIASDYGHKPSIGLDRLLYQRADGALVRLTHLSPGR